MTEKAMITILVTGFGPFPGAPFNPTGPLVQRLARLHPARARIVTHIFETSYAAVDRDLPKLIARYRPDALLMFGLATQATALRIETRARNELILIPDATGMMPSQVTLAPGKAAAMAMPTPVRRLLAAIRASRLPVVISDDAGGYLCNYLCWRAVEAAGKNGGPLIAAFVHVPLIRRAPVPRRGIKNRPLTLPDLVRAGSAVLRATATAAAVRR
jgi:pyroglutamyl-peptidase